MLDVYLAGPYSSVDEVRRRARVRLLTAVAAELSARGLVVFSPITHSVPLEETGLIGGDWETWREIDTAFIKVCREVWVVMAAGWDCSVGVVAEISLARELGKVVRFVPVGLNEQPGGGYGVAGDVFDLLVRGYRQELGEVVELRGELALERRAVRDALGMAARAGVGVGEEGDTDGQGRARTGREESDLATEGTEGTEGESVAGGTLQVAREEGDTDGQGRARTGREGSDLATEGTEGTEGELREELEEERGRCWELAERVVFWQEQVRKQRGELEAALAAEREVSERLSADLVRKEEERKELWVRARDAEREAHGLPGLREELAELKRWWESAVERHRKSAEQEEYWRKKSEENGERWRGLELRLEEEKRLREQMVRLEVDRRARPRWRFGWR